MCRRNEGLLAVRECLIRHAPFREIEVSRTAWTFRWMDRAQLAERPPRQRRLLRGARQLRRVVVLLPETIGEPFRELHLLDLVATQRVADFA